MSVVAEFVMSPESFPLGEAVRVPPGGNLELERLVPTDRGVLPYLWVRSDDLDAYLTGLRDLPAVQSLEVLDRFESDALIRARWDAPSGSFLDFLTSEEVAILSMTGTEEGWRVEVRGERRAVERLSRFCRDAALGFELSRIYEASLQPPTPHGELTNVQRRTLARAFEAGYFDEPRRTSLTALSAELGVSERAVSRRLRRAVRNVIEDSLSRGL